MRIYKATTWSMAIAIILVSILFLFFGYLETKDSGRTLLVGLMLVLLFGTVLLLASRYTYLHITDRYLRSVHMLFGRRSIPIDDITHITQEGTYYVLESWFKSLYVYYSRNGKERVKAINLAIFSEPTLARLLKDLKDINHNIQLDTFCKRLVKKELAVEV